MNRTLLTLPTILIVSLTFGCSKKVEQVVSKKGGGDSTFGLPADPPTTPGTTAIEGEFSGNAGGITSSYQGSIAAAVGLPNYKPGARLFSLTMNAKVSAATGVSSDNRFVVKRVPSGLNGSSSGGVGNVCNVSGNGNNGYMYIYFNGSICSGINPLISFSPYSLRLASDILEFTSPVDYRNFELKFQANGDVSGNYNNQTVATKMYVPILETSTVTTVPGTILALFAVGDLDNVYVQMNRNGQNYYVKNRRYSSATFGRGTESSRLGVGGPNGLYFEDIDELYATADRGEDFVSMSASLWGPPDSTAEVEEMVVMYLPANLPAVP